MATAINDRDISHTLAAAKNWIENCLIKDGSMFSALTPLWTASLIEELTDAFIRHPDLGSETFMTKLRKQIGTASVPATQLMAEMMWALLLFPSNMKPATKRQQIRDIWKTSGQQIPESSSYLADDVLYGIGSGGPGFNNYRYLELAFLITTCSALKKLREVERRTILTDYDAFIAWIDVVPQEGRRQFRHMLRYFCFPERVERISSNNDRYKILESFDVAPIKDTRNWTDRQLDEALVLLRSKLEKTTPGGFCDFYQPDIKQRWSAERTVKTLTGEVTVAVPGDDDESEQEEDIATVPEARQSIQMQAKLAKIGAIMGFKIWVPRSDRVRVLDQLAPEDEGRAAFIDELPLGYDPITLATIQQIDVLWVKGRSIGRAFEVEHTTAVYSGLLRMADLLALVPNMDIHLHIVAPDERREKVFHEMKWPVFSLLERGPLSKSCTFMSYDSVDAIFGIPHLAHTNPTVIDEYAEHADEM